MTELLRLENLCKYYTSNQSVVMGLNSINLQFHQGEFVAITGESGSGKSTLAHVLGGILPYESGELFFKGQPTSHFDSSDYERYRRDHIGFISQSYGILPSCTVLQNVVSALRLSGMEKQAADAKATEILKEVELWDLQSRRASKLSSGQKQRLSIARALAKPAPVLIADEPTGNLDPENSRKVISLLARAAKTRLVILITHEFSEAAQDATRHIVIKDGKVAMDAALQPQNTPEALSKSVPAKQSLSTYVSRLQLSGRPVWTSFLLLFFALTAFAVFAFLGTFIVALDDTSTRIYDNSAFQNGDLGRIVAIRPDNAPMTQSDYDTILSLDHIVDLERYSYVADIRYAYREDVDYKQMYAIEDNGTLDTPDVALGSWMTLTDQAGFLQTVPLLAEGEFLTAGRLPDNHREVVMTGSPDLIGTSFPVLIQDEKHWGISDFLQFDVQVVGVTDHGSGLFFHDHIGRIFTQYIVSESNMLFLPADDLSDEQVRTNPFRYDLMMKYKEDRVKCFLADIPVTTETLRDPDNYLYLQLIQNPEDMKESDPAWVSPTHELGLNIFYEVSPATFEKVTRSSPSDQVSITVEDYAYTDRVLEALQENGYIALSPFQEGSTQVNESRAAERKQTLTVCVLVLIAVLALQVVVLRALFGTQTESYKLLSNIGLTRPAAKLSVLWQILLFTGLGQLLSFGALLLSNQLGVARIVDLMRYLPASHWLILMAVHLTGALIGGAWVTHSIMGQVFPIRARQNDLPTAGEEVRA